MSQPVSSLVAGKATFYGGNLNGGACSFSTYTLPTFLKGTAFSGSAWADASHCGSCMEVQGPKGTVKVMVTDQCPECAVDHLDLFQNAFEEIGTLQDGIIPITYKPVPCGIADPFFLRSKEGSSPYWFSVQVVNANGGVSKLEVSVDDGASWVGTERKQYNFFEHQSGFRVDTVHVRVTAQSGETIRVDGVSVQGGRQTYAPSNFKGGVAGAATGAGAPVPAAPVPPPALPPAQPPGSPPTSPPTQSPAPPPTQPGYGPPPPAKHPAKHPGKHPGKHPARHGIQTTSTSPERAPDVPLHQGEKGVGPEQTQPQMILRQAR